MSRIRVQADAIALFVLIALIATGQDVTAGIFFCGMVVFNGVQLAVHQIRR